MEFEYEKMIANFN